MWPSRVFFAFIAGTLFATAALGSAFAQNIDMGESYRNLDLQVVSMVTEFSDAVVTTRRSPDGSLETEVQGINDPDSLRLKLAPAVLLTISTTLLAEGTEHLPGPSFLPLTDWANFQALSLWRDLATVRKQQGWKVDSAQLTWSGRFLRPWQLTRASSDETHSRADDLTADLQAVTTTFVSHGGTRLVAKSIRERTTGEAPAWLGKRGGTTVHPATFTTVLYSASTGAQLGLLRWFKTAKVVSWDFPGVTEGWVDPDRQERPYPFKPNLVWGTIQAFGFWQASATTSLEKMTKFQVLDGCTGLHWLDQSIYRPCCDEHDRCYYRHGCSAWSWWVIGSGWSCIRCNIEAVLCFATVFVEGGGGDPPDDGGDPCTVYGSSWCPMECMSCTRLY